MTGTDPLLAAGFNRLKACRHGWMLYNINDVYIGRSLDLYGEFSEGEIMLFRQLLRPGDVVVDVGANIGAHTVFFAKAVGPMGIVLAFEPQRVVHQTLCANIALNSLSNTYCIHAALGAREGWIIVPLLDYACPNNFGGISLGGSSTGEQTRMMTLDSMRAPACRLIKIDVEGMEQEVLLGAAHWIEQFRPILYIENDRPEKSAELITHVLGLGYRLYWHAPALFQADNYFRNETNVFGNVVTLNMLCVDAASQWDIQGDIQGLVEVRCPEDRWHDSLRHHM
jgi:FkbM family methyltransferase